MPDYSLQLSEPLDVVRQLGGLFVLFDCLVYCLPQLSKDLTMLLFGGIDQLC